MNSHFYAFLFLLAASAFSFNKFLAQISCQDNRILKCICNALVNVTECKPISIQDCIPVGCIPPARWPYLPVSSARRGGGGGTCLIRVGGGWSRGGVCLPSPGGGGGYLPGPGGGPAWSQGGRVGVLSQQALRQTPPPPPPTCEQNHRRLWKYYLAPTSLRAVIITIWTLESKLEVNFCRNPMPRLPVFLRSEQLSVFLLWHLHLHLRSLLLQHQLTKWSKNWYINIKLEMLKRVS